MVVHFQLIHQSAVFPDLSFGPKQRTNPTHLHHGRSKIPIKRSNVGTVSSNQRVLRSIIKQLLIGMKKPSASHKRLVVVIIKCVRSCVERSQVGISRIGRAGSLASGGKAWVDVGLVVDASPEGRTL